ncbi:MAG: hypothetical protein KC503_41780, partial [Myxococcales bacterium]|nr:hypothetical protein [Myxococcales bacterium]
MTRALAVVLLLSCVPRVALADDAQQLLRQAEAKRREGDIAGALAILARAAKRTRDDVALGRIHLLEALTHGTDAPARARAAFVEALRHDPTLDVSTQRYKPALVQLYRSARATLSGTLRAEGPAGARVIVDGAAAGSVPASSKLEVGRHLVEIRDGAGQLLLRKEIVVRVGALVTLRAESTRATRRAASKPTAPAAATPARRGFWRRRRLWTWIAAGATVAAAGVAIGFGLAARAAHDDASARADALGNDPVAMRHDESLLAAISRLDDRRLVTNMAWAGCAAFGVAAAVLLFVEGRAEAPAERTERRSLSVAPTLGGAQLRL